MLTEVHTVAAYREYVSCVAFSPDGKLLAAGSDADSGVKVWSVGNWKERSRIQTLGDGIRSVRFFPAGRRLLAGSRGAIWLIDVRKGEPVDFFEVPSAVVFGAVALPDEKRFVSYGHDGRLRLSDIASKDLLFESKEFKGSGGPIDCSADGRYCALGAVAAVSLWDLRALKEMHFLRGHKRQVRGLAFSRTGRILASGGDDRKILFWDVPAGTRLVSDL
jgi:WD40 repeat protein